MIAACGLLAVACVGGHRGRVDSDTKAELTQNRDAFDRLEFGMTPEAARAIMGGAHMTPPWANAWGIGPQIVEDPIDTLEFESPSGESYTVKRYALELYGDPNCPFVRGEATLAPLIFVNGKLVGWRWTYLESALQRPLAATEREFRFGGFCGGSDEESREQPDSAAPRSDTGGPNASDPDTRQ